jgi:hypothetical protein
MIATPDLSGIELNRYILAIFNEWQPYIDAPVFAKCLPFPICNAAWAGRLNSFFYGLIETVGVF